MKKLAVVAIAAVAIALVAFGMGNLSNTKTQNQEAAQAAADFTLPAIKGGDLTLSTYKGSVVLLDFWASFCPPCREEIPELIQLYDTYKDKGLVVIGVSLDRISPEELKRVCESMNINYPIVRGNDTVAAQYGGIRYIPTLFVLDRNMKITKKFIGYTSRATIESEIKELL